MGSTFYLRRDGCVGYEGDFLKDRKTVGAFPRQLLSLGGSWLWASSRIRPLAKESVSSLPENRLLTQLCPEISDALTADLLERDTDGYGRSIFLFGIDRVRPEDIQSQEMLESQLRSFALHGSGPIHLVLLQPGDAKDLVFVPAVPSAVVVQALQCLGVNQSTPEKTRNYKDLHGMQLESLIHKIIAMAFDNIPHHRKAPEDGRMI